MCSITASVVRLKNRNECKIHLNFQTNRQLLFTEFNNSRQSLHSINKKNRCCRKINAIVKRTSIKIKVRNRSYTMVMYIFALYFLNIHRIIERFIFA